MPLELPMPGCPAAQPAASATHGVAENPITVPALLRRAARRVGGLLRRLKSRMRESQELSLLSDRDLRDMNVSLYDIARAERKPFWKE